MGIPCHALAAACFALALFSVSSVAAHADDLVFTSTDGTNTLSFVVNSNPTGTTVIVDSIYLPGTAYGFYLETDVDVNGVSSLDYVSFYDSEYGGGFDIAGQDGTDILDQFDDSGYVVGPGSVSQQEYSGTLDSPTFSAGGPYLTESYNYETNPTFQNDFSTTITPTPEPGSLVLLGTGILGIVGGVRRRLK